MKKLLTWLFQDFLYQLYDMAENKFTLHAGILVATKTFTPSTIPVGGISVLELIFFKSPFGANPFTFNDAYPIGMVNANPLGLIDTLGGVVAVSGGNSIGTTTGILLADTPTSVKVNVTSFAVGTYNNPIPFTLNPTLFATLTVVPKKKKTNATAQYICAKDVEGDHLRFRGVNYQRIKKDECYFVPIRRNINIK